MSESTKEVVEPKKISDFKHATRILEEKIIESGGLVGHECDESLLPLEHFFCDSLYVRQITMPAGVVLTSKIHKTRHPYFVIKGRCLVATEEGPVEIVAPHFGITERGTKRVIKILEDTVWITCHPTEETDLDVIEDQIIAPTFKDVPLEHEEIKLLKEV